MSELTSLETASVAKQRALQFLDENSLPHPRRFDMLRGPNRSFCGRYLFDERVVQVWWQMCVLPGRGYSWPGYTADKTVLGVCAHETGHHLSAIIDRAKRREWARCGDRYREFAVSSYARGAEEDMAETTKLFVTNPSLLEAICPWRYWFFTEQLGLRSPETRHWMEVLAPSKRHVEMALSKVSRAFCYQLDRLARAKTPKEAQL